MNRSDERTAAAKLSAVRGGPLFESLPRIAVSASSPPNRKANTAVDAAYGITSAKKLSEAFAVKRNLSKGT